VFDITASTWPAPSALPARQEAATIGLIGLAHGTSHFHHMLLTPLFPVFMHEYGLSYDEMGLLVSVFFVISGFGQALAGFVVDRVGARPVLFAALSSFVAASLAAATARGYAGLVLASALAGLGNASFHPVDFTILNRRVSLPRLGHAFSIHGISGNLGWAAAPTFLMGIHAATGQWRWAYVASALAGLLVLALLVRHRDVIDDHHEAHRAHLQTHQANQAHPLAFMRLPSVWLCFSFFFWSTAALCAVQSFVSPALNQLYGLPLSTGAMVVTGYMISGAAGMFMGGFLVSRVTQLERLISAALLLAATLLLLAGLRWLPGPFAAWAVALGGFGTGLAGPSRDMLIKRAAPPGATGRVYGTVYSGLDLGFAVAAPLLGALMDRGLPTGVFYGAAATLVLGVGSALLVGKGVNAPA
jgi:MFS family permease